MKPFEPHEVTVKCKLCGEPITYIHKVEKVIKTRTGTMTAFTQAPLYHDKCKNVDPVRSIENKDGSFSIYF